jgi:very-short-patch-repair endonuclease
MNERVMTLQEALSAGLTRKQVRRRLESGEWLRLFHGVYFVPSAPPLFSDWCAAALRYAGEDARLWGATSARLHGVEGFTPAPGKESPGVPIVVAVASKRRIRAKLNLICVRSRSFAEADFTKLDGLECTTAVRSVIEASPDAPWNSVVMAFEDLHRRKKHRELAKRIRELQRGRPPFARLEALMARRGPNAVATDSAAEAICDDILFEGQLVAERQFKVREGSTLRKIDLAFPSIKLGIECDSRMWHTAKDAFENDRARWAWLAAQGWQLLHFTWTQLHDRPYVIETVRAAMRARSTLRVG